MNRRELICGVSASLIATSCPLPAAQDQLASVVRRASVKFAGRKLAPLYAVAYVNPLLPDQQGQETSVAKYRWRWFLKTIASRSASGGTKFGS